MLYSALDTGNFHVIRGSPVDVWAAESYRKSHFKYQVGEKFGFGVEDFVVLVVGNSFYNELSPEYSAALYRMGPLLTKYARKKNAGESFKFLFLCGNSTAGCNDALQVVFCYACQISLPSNLPVTAISFFQMNRCVIIGYVRLGKYGLNYSMSYLLKILV